MLRKFSKAIHHNSVDWCVNTFLEKAIWKQMFDFVAQIGNYIYMAHWYTELQSPSLARRSWAAHIGSSGSHPWLYTQITRGALENNGA